MGAETVRARVATARADDDPQAPSIPPLWFALKAWWSGCHGAEIPIEWERWIKSTVPVGSVGGFTVSFPDVAKGRTFTTCLLIDEFLPFMRFDALYFIVTIGGITTSGEI